MSSGHLTHGSKRAVSASWLLCRRHVLENWKSTLPDTHTPPNNGSAGVNAACKKFEPNSCLKFEIGQKQSFQINILYKNILNIYMFQ